MNTKRLFQILLAIGAAFFAFEAIIHGIPLPILEHDKIFLPTHDRYIAIFAGGLVAALLVLIATDIQKYRVLFIVTMISIFAGMLNASFIAANEWYTNKFNAPSLDANLSIIGHASVAWYTLVCILWLRLRKIRSTDG